MKEVKDNFQAFLTEDAKFVSKEEYPLLEKWMIAEEPPNKIVPFNKIKEVKNPEEYYDEKGFSDFSYVILTLKNQMKDFNPKNYGAKNKQVLPFFQNELKQYYQLNKQGTIYSIKIK